MQLQSAGLPENITPDEAIKLFCAYHDVAPRFDRLERGAQRTKEEVVKKPTLTQAAVILAHALVGWALCGAIIWVGMAVISMETTLILHAIGAPVIFWAIASIYFKRFNYTTPLQTATIFVAVVVFVDFFLVALLIEKSFAMFASLIGTWIPWTLIFVSTYLRGLLEAKRTKAAAAA